MFGSSAKKRRRELIEWHGLTSYPFLSAVREGLDSDRFHGRYPDYLLWHDASVAAAIDVAETIGAGSVEALKSIGGAEAWRGMSRQAAVRAMDAKMGFIVARLTGPHRGPAKDLTARIPLYLDDHRAVSLNDPWCAALFELHLRHHFGAIELGGFRSASSWLMELVDSAVAGREPSLDSLLAWARGRGTISEWDLTGYFDGPSNFLERPPIGAEETNRKDYVLRGECGIARDLRERFGDQLADALGGLFGTQ